MVIMVGYGRVDVREAVGDPRVGEGEGVRGFPDQLPPLVKLENQVENVEGVLIEEEL